MNTDLEKSLIFGSKFGFRGPLNDGKNTPQGQLISKCPFGVFKSSKKPRKFFPKISALALKKRSNQKSSVRESK